MVIPFELIIFCESFLKKHLRILKKKIRKPEEFFFFKLKTLLFMKMIIFLGEDSVLEEKHKAADYPLNPSRDNIF